MSLVLFSLYLINLVKCVAQSLLSYTNFSKSEVHEMKTSRLFAIFLAILLTLSVFAVPAFAAGALNSQGTWDTYTQQLANSGGFSDAEDLGKRLSSLAGGSTTNYNGVVYTTVIVGATGKSGAMYFVGGTSRQYTGTSGPTAPPDTNGNYDTYSVTAQSRDDSNISATIYVYKNADSRSLSKVQSNISSGLLSQAGVSPDTGTAMNLLSGVMPMINTALGLIVTIISIGMTVFSALDIIYLAFPAFRGKVDSQVEGGGKGTKTNKDGSTSSIWVSDDARVAVKETQENQQQPWGAYFKKRVIAYIFLAIILFILLTGNIFAITTLVTDALSGLFSALGIG